ncbi:MAG: cupin, partial [Actinomycetota bacterium]|nr:cupin [Actinomycetota bacterium]
MTPVDGAQAAGATTQPERLAEAGEVVLPAGDVDATVAFFVERLGFRLQMIMPADSPRVAVLVGHGMRVRLDVAAQPGPGALRLTVDETEVALPSIVAPNGTHIEFVAADVPLIVPPLAARFELTTAAHAASGMGRAGMRYRDLLPSRLGGRFIASHIAIPEGGPVPDYVHSHRIRFQMIYCAAGWVRVVYEDQGPPFVMHAGDCVLQPPGLRHRVLESSPGFEAVEIGCPAEHETYPDHDVQLPTAARRPDRDFGGQRFVHHVAAGASWAPWRAVGFECRDTGIGDATKGLAG